ncbi:hypothetical protein RvY_08172 [Ramazzottius varieornatus]|uniref:Uncharacterized protein n=1 Tax=Ramazzottius varieornatus TaxID=947166 RepID=A0A1D1V500_RAMVA|nr:hypothetical protein RvY_08172 [Ramazzottius varieornatus]
MAEHLRRLPMSQPVIGLSTFQPLCLIFYSTIFYESMQCTAPLDAVDGIGHGSICCCCNVNGALAHHI